VRAEFGAELTWLPFDLHPEYPPEGIPRSQLRARYGEEFHERLKQWFKRDGLTYNPPPDVVPNTMNALRVTELARERDVHEPVHDRLMKAYWEEARNIGDPGELQALAVEAGLEEADVAEVLASDAYRDRVLGSTAQAQSIGITGIPAFLLDRRLLVLGAQPLEVFRRSFEQLRADSP
jgi:predicted DsbA family dithiol-disulfide isomerase